MSKQGTEWTEPGQVICAFHDESTPFFMPRCVRVATAMLRHFEAKRSTPCCEECADDLMLSGDWDRTGEPLTAEDVARIAEAK